MLASLFSKDRMSPWLAPAVVALVTWLSIVPCIDPGGSYPNWPEGPGLTVDEIFNVQQGVYLAELLRTNPVGLFDPTTIRQAFSLPDHPPLGRLWLGVHHQVMWSLCPPDSPDGPFVVACARTGSATAFALTILLVGGFTSLWISRWAGLMAALALALLPRAYGHAHLAALETCMGLAFTAAVLVAAHTWPGESPPKWRTAAWTGAIFGLALLTKIQAVFIPIPLAVWAIYRWRARAIKPLVIWGVVGFAVFFGGWPWLWLDPVDHLRSYLGGTTNRAELSVWAWGEKFTDRTVPRPYALLSFFWIMPLKLLVLGFLGLIGRWPWSKKTSPIATISASYPLTPRDTLVIFELAFPLLMFSLPRVPVYDAERLWLPAVPLFAVVVGRGAELVWRRVQAVWKKAAPWVQVVILGTMVTQVSALVFIRPCYLCHFGSVTFGLKGAAQRGLELNYWGDAVTRTLLKKVVEQTPAGATIAVAPVLHQFQVEELLRQSPILRRHGVTLVAYDPAKNPTEYVLLFRRLADLPPELREGPAEAELLAEESRYDVQLAALYRVKR